MMGFSESTQHDGDSTYADNGRTDAHNNENVAGSNKLMLAIAEADNAIHRCNDRLLSEVEKLGGTIPTAGVVAGIYTAYCAIEAAGRREQFLAERGIKIHGNTQNECYPIFRAFTKKVHSWLRDRVCKYATVAALARHEGVLPHDFPGWLKDHPIEEACEEYRRIKAELEEAKRRAFMVDASKYPEKVPTIQATPVTHGHIGLKLGVLEFAKDGSGEFRLLGILPHERNAVMRMVMTAARNAT
ncbi:hypothetical protein GCM10022626_14180 [[Pseudomonas] carboxydohydrogena]